MVCSSPLKTETMTGGAVIVLCHVKVHGGTIAVPPLTSMASTCVERMTVEVSGGAHSTQLLIATHTSGQK